MRRVEKNLRGCCLGLVSALCLLGLVGCGQTPAASDPAYLSAAYAGEAFVLCGTGGRLDRITADKQVETLDASTQADLLDVWSDGERVMVCGRNGTLLFSPDGTNFQTVSSGVHTDLYQIAYLKGKYLVCGAKGTLLSSADGQSWERQDAGTDRDLISIAAAGQSGMAVTAHSDVLLSQDGENWTIDNFNETYQGYYDPDTFTGVTGMGETFFVTGQLADSPEKPVILYTPDGQTWMKKELTEINGEAPGEDFSLTIRSLGYDADQLLAVCDGGQLLTITECSVCNEMSQVGSEDLNAIAYGDGKVLVAGDNFFFDILDGSEVRQDRIQAEQALEDFENGAQIIDVREDDELAQSGYITGSLHIPLAEVEEKLPELVPDRDTELIFYCARGARAQTALETAQTLGYQRVYNLGGLSDWPYDITH